MSKQLGMTLLPLPLRDPEETDLVFNTLSTDANGLLVENSVINLLAQEQICRLAIQRRLPAIGTFHEFAAAGCLMSYGENLPDIYRRAAGYVDKILKGARPSDLPVMRATSFDLVINLQNAKALGLHFPASLLARAADVIE